MNILKAALVLSIVGLLHMPADAKEALGDKPIARLEIEGGFIYIDISNVTNDNIRVESFDLAQRRGAISLFAYDHSSKKLLTPSFTAFVWSATRQQPETVVIEPMKSKGVIARLADIEPLFDLQTGCYLFMASIRYTTSKGRQQTPASKPRVICTKP